MNDLLASDRALLGRFREGDPNALREVYLHYAPKVSSFLKAGFSFSSGAHVCSFQGYARPYELENARQEVFMRAFAPRARLAYDGIHPFTDYLFGISRNFVISELRRYSAAVERFQVGLDDEAPALADSTAPNAQDLLEEREVDRLLEEFLSSLDDLERRFHTVRFLDQRTQEEAARAMGLTRIRLRRIEKRFRIKLLGFFKQRGYLDTREGSQLGRAIEAMLR